MHAVDKNFQYLKSNLGNGLFLRKGDTLTLNMYTDVDYVGSIIDSKSTSRKFLGESLVTWRSKNTG